MGAAAVRENHTYGGQDEKSVSNAMLMIELQRLVADEMRHLGGVEVYLRCL